MMALRFNVPGVPASQVLDRFSVYEKCGAQAYVENEGNTVIVQFPEDQFEIIKHCVEGKLDAEGKALLEHAIASWDMEYNYALDNLAELGHSKEDRDTQGLAKKLAYASITGQIPPGEEYKLGKAGKDYIELSLISEGPYSRVKEYSIPIRNESIDEYLTPAATFVVTPSSAYMFKDLYQAEEFFNRVKSKAEEEYKLGPNKLPIVQFKNGKTKYYFDERLKELRDIGDPLSSLPLNEKEVDVLKQWVVPGGEVKLPFTIDEFEHAPQGPVLDNYLVRLLLKFVPPTVVEQGGEFEMPEELAYYFDDELSYLKHIGVLKSKGKYEYLLTPEGVGAINQYGK